MIKEINSGYGRFSLRVYRDDDGKPNQAFLICGTDVIELEKPEQDFNMLRQLANHGEMLYDVAVQLPKEEANEKTD